MTAPDEQFPRTARLPGQSPLYWVQQKDRYLRQLAIRDIEAITKRRLVVYFANRIELAQIDAGDVALMAELLGDVGSEPVDILVETGGGFTDATEALISLIQNTVSDFRVIVANGAKSNGTLLALAANSIVMGVSSELGPIEPLVGGLPCSILEQAEVAKNNYPLHMMGKYALQQTRSLARKLLSSGMMKGAGDTKVDQTVQALSSRTTYFSHGSVINYKEATDLGLKVEFLPPGDDLWQRIWLLHCIVDFDCRRARYLKLFEGRARSTAITATAQAPRMAPTAPPTPPAPNLTVPTRSPPPVPTHAVPPPPTPPGAAPDPPAPAAPVHPLIEPAPGAVAIDSV